MTAQEARNEAMEQKGKNSLYVVAQAAIVAASTSGLFSTTVPCGTTQEDHAAVAMLVLDGYSLDILKDGNKGFAEVAALAGDRNRHAIYLRISWSPAHGYTP